MHPAIQSWSRWLLCVPAAALVVCACMPAHLVSAEDSAVKPRPKLVIRPSAVETIAKGAETTPPKTAIATTNPDKAVAVPTHRQASTIQVNAPGHPQVKISCFCLTPDDRILAGCMGTTGEIRVLDAEGKLSNSWFIPVNPEAIFCRADGAVFVAGEGQILKLSQDGKIELSQPAPRPSRSMNIPKSSAKKWLPRSSSRPSNLPSRPKFMTK